MNRSLVHRAIFTLMLSGIMSGVMTYVVSSFYCDPRVGALLPIWLQAWVRAFSVIFIVSLLLHYIAPIYSEYIKKIML